MEGDGGGDEGDVVVAGAGGVRGRGPDGRKGESVDVEGGVEGMQGADEEGVVSGCLIGTGDEEDGW